MAAARGDRRAGRRRRRAGGRAEEGWQASAEAFAGHSAGGQTSIVSGARQQSAPAAGASMRKGRTSSRAVGKSGREACERGARSAEGLLGCRWLLAGEAVPWLPCCLAAAAGKSPFSFFLAPSPDGPRPQARRRPPELGQRNFKPAPGSRRPQAPCHSFLSAHGPLLPPARADTGVRPDRLVSGQQRLRRPPRLCPRARGRPRLARQDSSARALASRPSTPRQDSR